jgi:DNA polymerase (family 10)
LTRVRDLTGEPDFVEETIGNISIESIEDRGEIEAAEKRRLPTLVTRDDLKGDLHVHTAATDGTATIRQMAEEARRARLAYIAIADHTQSLRVVHSLDVKRLRRQMAEIEKINRLVDGITILKTAEVDILADGHSLYQPRNLGAYYKTRLAGALIGINVPDFGASTA